MRVRVRVRMSTSRRSTGVPAARMHAQSPSGTPEGGRERGEQGREGGAAGRGGGGG